MPVNGFTQHLTSERKTAGWVILTAAVAGTAGFLLGAGSQPRVGAQVDHPEQVGSKHELASDSQALPSGSPGSGMPVNRAALVGALRMPEGIAGASAAEMRQLSEKRKAQLEARFQSEPIDTVWSNTAEVALLDAAGTGEIAESEIVPDDIDIQCRSTSCRVSSVFLPGTDADTWTSYYILQMAGTLPRSEIVTIMRPDGTTEVSLYGRR